MLESFLLTRQAPGAAVPETKFRTHQLDPMRNICPEQLNDANRREAAVADRDRERRRWEGKRSAPAGRLRPARSAGGDRGEFPTFGHSLAPHRVQGRHPSRGRDRRARWQPHSGPFVVEGWKVAQTASRLRSHPADVGRDGRRIEDQIGFTGSNIGERPKGYPS